MLLLRVGDLMEAGGLRGELDLQRGECDAGVDLRLLEARDFLCRNQTAFGNPSMYLFTTP